ncbi:MAG: glycosyltransferase [Candidatus Kapabacteria bacterium]|nr:glycosyltransferase [Candidatus Kapabacteria bacterium]
MPDVSALDFAAAITPWISPALQSLSLLNAGVMTLLLGISVFNLVRFARLPRAASAPSGDLAPSVAVLIPARNEERGIERCVRSLCSQSYEKMQVIVLDDGSSDATPEILSRLADEYSNLRVISGSPLPKGWVGKSWACHQLSQQTSADVLLFTDADTWHEPTTVERSVAFLRQQRLAMFSMVPYQVLSTFGEHAVIPMVHVLYFSYLPNSLIMSNPRVSLSAANGQFMCFSRQGYEAIGGHKAVWNSLVEDVFLARAVKAAGLRIALVDGTDAVACHMYTNAREVTEGFSKNLFPATQYNLPVTLLFLAHLLVTYVGPVATSLAVMALPWPNAEYVLAASIYALAAAALIRLMISLRFRMPVWHAFLQPVTALWTVVIGLNSIRWALSSRGSQWKGRSYARTGETP